MRFSSKQNVATNLITSDMELAFRPQTHSLGKMTAHEALVRLQIFGTVIERTVINVVLINITASIIVQSSRAQ